jgi:hypothetical protein
LDDPAWPARFRITLRGRLGDTLLAAFPVLRAEPRGGDTVLVGALPDQAALRLELLELRRLPPT